MGGASAAKIRIRQISEADLGPLANCFAKWFPRRRAGFWRRALARLAEHPAPPDLPKYGYLLTSNEQPVGAVLTICSKVPSSEGPMLRCNLSSWYVDPAYRSYAPLLSKRALRHGFATYVNVSAAPHTHSIIEAQGFARFSNGQFLTLAVPWRRVNGRVEIFQPGCDPQGEFEPFERDLLEAHARYGCMSVWCVTPQRAYPFVFRPLLVKRVLPCARLVYCRDIQDFAEFAPAIGRFLIRQGRPLVLVDANGPIPGLTGMYLEGLNPKYFRGASRPRLGDLAYTEAAMFGV